MHTAILPSLLVALSPDLAAPGAESNGDPCETMLDNLYRAADAQGYALSRATARLEGDDGAGNRMDARCDSGHGRIDLASIDGSRVSVELALDPLDAGALEIVGEFPGAGSVARTVVLTGSSADGVTGFLTAAADVGADRAVAEFDLGSDAWTNAGDAAAVSFVLAPVLGASKIWKEDMCSPSPFPGRGTDYRTRPARPINPAGDARRRGARPHADVEG